MTGVPARLALACVVPTVVILISFMILKTKKKKLTDKCESEQTANACKQTPSDIEKLQLKTPSEETNAENPTSWCDNFEISKTDEMMEQRSHWQETTTQDEGSCNKSRSSSSSTYSDTNNVVPVETSACGNVGICENEQGMNEVIESFIATKKEKEIGILSAFIDRCDGDATELKSDICRNSKQSISDSCDVEDDASKLNCLNTSSIDEAVNYEKESKLEGCKDSKKSNSSLDGLSECSAENIFINVSRTKTQSIAGEDAKLQITVNSDSDVDIDSRDAAYSPPYTTGSNCSDAQSEGSSDSGKGSSDVHTPASSTPNSTNLPDCIVFEFELPQNLCGVLIGKKGSHVNMIKEKTGAFISVQTHLFDPTLSLCAVIGANDEVENALRLVRKKFPISKYPNITLTQVNTMTPAAATVIPQTAQLHLPEGVMCEVIVVSIVSAGHVFLQQPTHPSYPSLSRLDDSMQACYAHTDTPEMPRPVEGGHICVAPLSGGWYRAQVSTVYPETDECDVKFVDHGGYSQLPISSLRQIRSDFMSLPFQTEECYLAHVAPVNEDFTWSVEAQACVETLAKGQILEAQIISYAEDGIPMVDLYRIQGHSYILINRELTERGLARWVEG